MPTNPYENPDFARKYVLSEVDRSKNRYEWEVTHPSTLQFLDSSVERVLDYGCGSGIFTAGITQRGRRRFNPSLESIGTDASPQMLRYASMMGNMTDGVSFQKWDASNEESPFESKTFDRIFAKLVLNYVSKDSLYETVMPRLRHSLNDEGLMIAILPNPLREVAYSKAKYNETIEMSIDVGSFNLDSPAVSYRHTYEEMIESADKAGFAYGRVLGLPEVRFMPYKKQLMKIAHPMPMILDTLNAAKRWVYVFGATEASASSFDSAVNRFENWRTDQYPEIADRAHFRVTGRSDTDIDLPLNLEHEGLYDYVNTFDQHNKNWVSIDASYAEHMTPEQKNRFVRILARKGIRDKVNIDNFLVTI